MSFNPLIIGAIQESGAGGEFAYTTTGSVTTRTHGIYTSLQWTGSGTWVVTGNPAGLTFDLWMIAGGGGGGVAHFTTNTYLGGGAGGGARNITGTTIPVGTITMQVPAGGVSAIYGTGSGSANPGANAQVTYPDGSLVAANGGGHGSSNNGGSSSTMNGGCGGGGGMGNSSTGGTGNAGSFSPVEGYAGGNANTAWYLNGAGGGTPNRVGTSPSSADGGTTGTQGESNFYADGNTGGSTAGVHHFGGGGASCGYGYSFYQKTNGYQSYGCTNAVFNTQPNNAVANSGAGAGSIVNTNSAWHYSSGGSGTIVVRFVTPT